MTVPLSREDYAWAAGLLDGDGCITLGKNGRFRRPEVVVDSTDLEILHEMRRIFGGGCISKKAKVQGHHRQAWHWRVNGSDCVLALLSAVVAYMRCPSKRDRAQFLLTHWRSVTPRNGKYTEEQVQAKLAFETEFFLLGAGRGSTMRRAAGS